jgi:hypothetical protein
MKRRMHGDLNAAHSASLGKPFLALTPSDLLINGHIRFLQHGRRLFLCPNGESFERERMLPVP